MICEASVQRASGGFGMYQRAADGPIETEFTDLSDWADYMSGEYEWRWAEEIEGKIYEQNGGRPFAWRAPGQTDEDGWAYGLIYAEGDDA